MAAALLAVERGAHIVRVHDVKETVAALKVRDAMIATEQRQRQEPTLMSRTYFGTDGIRGTVGQPPITPDFVLRLAHAVGRVLKKTEQRPTVLIGKDTRISGYMLESALESGFNSAGVDVVLLGPLPTPGVAYLTRAQRASLGVVISASHNPYPDNGIKFFSGQGTKLPDEWELAVEAALQEPPAWADSAGLGKARRLDDAAGRYIEFCKSTFASDLTLRGHDHRGRRRAWRGVPHRAQGLPRTRRRGDLHRLLARRPEHQRPGRRHASRGAGGRGARPTRPTSASRWTATPTGCSWWTRRAACTTATNCST